MEKTKDYLMTYSPIIDPTPYPDFFLIITKAMKDLYHKYARSIGFDFTYSMIRETAMAKGERI